MASIPGKVKKTLREFVIRIEQEVSPQVVLLYGSYAKGKHKKGSDIDVAVFAKKFEGKNFIEITSYLFSKTSGMKIDLQPVGFPYHEFEKSNGEYLVELIKKEGIIIYLNGKFKFK